MVKCFFCGKEKPAHTGLHLLKNDGSTEFFCSSKCRRNSTKLKRDRRKVRWTDFFHIVREKARKKHAEREAALKEKAKAKESEKKVEKKVEKKTVKKAKKSAKKTAKKSAKKK